jgi:twitching motility protein PilT
MDTENRINSFLELVIKQNGSDLHLVSGNPPRMRLQGDIYPIKYRELDPDETLELLVQIMPAHKRKEFENGMSIDFTYEVSSLSRFRVNVFRHIKGVGAVFRIIPNEIKSLDDLKLPPVIKTLCRQNKGLVLVTGPTGSGKTTTLAAMVDYINNGRKAHIITIEDPIEYAHRNKMSLVSQREVGTHSTSFISALRSALREDPNVILVGELRDYETISMAVTAAEMGILIIGTLHTNSAATTIERIINVFPPGDEPFIRTMLSTSICGIISQQLIRLTGGRDRMAVAEIMLMNTAISNIIRQGHPDQINNVIQSGSLQGMQSFDNALRKLLDENLISGVDAYKKCRHKEDFEQYKLLQDELYN